MLADKIPEWSWLAKNGFRLPSPVDQVYAIPDIALAAIVIAGVRQEKPAFDSAIAVGGDAVAKALRALL